MKKTIQHLIFILILGSSFKLYAGDWEIGSGIFDITGPAGDAGMAGYGEVDHIAQGIHSRLWSRAFIIQKPQSEQSMVFVSTDLSHMSQGVKQAVVQRLRNRFGSRYNDANVMLTATHNHVGPGGYNHHVMMNLTSLGFNQRHFDTIVDGIFESIVMAFDNLEEGDVFINQGELLNASINRNPDPYSQNPDHVHFAHDTNKRMTVLKLVKDNGEEIGTINWFAVHNVSYSTDKKLIASDNKGIASQLFEKEMGHIHGATDNFVAAFASSNLGDVSPNVCGPQNGCAGNEDDSALLSATMQYNKARKLYHSAHKRLKGNLAYRHHYVRMQDYFVTGQFSNNPGRLCPAAVGQSFAAGSTWDGPSGMANFREGMTDNNPNNCHFPKSILTESRISNQGLYDLLSQVMNRQIPDSWRTIIRMIFQTDDLLEILANLFNEGEEFEADLYPDIIPFQMFTIGELAIVSVAGEMTTMSGRRLEAQLLNDLAPIGVKTIVFSGLANAYHGYITTPEEYQMQHYEGAHTIFGSRTLPAYVQIYSDLARSIVGGAINTATGPRPRDLSQNQVINSLLANLGFDDKPLFQSFGQVLQNANDTYSVGDTVYVKFRSGNPKNDYQTGSSFINIERRVNGQWQTYLTDNDISITFYWSRETNPTCLMCSFAEGKWTPNEDTPSGDYRMVHNGVWQHGVTGQQTPFVGVSDEFFVGNVKQTIALYNPTKQVYVQAQNAGGAGVYANGGWVRSWEKLGLIHVEDGLAINDPATCVTHLSTVAIQTGNRHYFSAKSNGDLDADVRHVRSWEKFTLENKTSTNTSRCLRDGDLISLRSDTHNRYLSAGTNGTANAAAPHTLSWEEFTVQFINPVINMNVSLKSQVNNNYLMAEENGGVALTARGITGSLPAEKLGMVLLEDHLPASQIGSCIKHGSLVALRAADGHFVTAHPSGNFTVAANQTENWQSFEVKNFSGTQTCLADGDIIQLETAHGKFIMIRDNQTIDSVTLNGNTPSQIYLRTRMELKVH